jgi:ribulose kinase
LTSPFLNGSRSPHNDGRLQAVVSGLSLGTTPGALYRAIADGLACGTRSMVAGFGAARDGQTGRPAPIAIERVIAAGGMSRTAPQYVQALADALERPIEISAVEQASAQGAAILGAVAAGVFDDARAAVQGMTPRAPGGPRVVSPDPGVLFHVPLHCTRILLTV